MHADATSDIGAWDTSAKAFVTVQENEAVGPDTVHDSNVTDICTEDPVTAQENGARYSDTTPESDTRDTSAKVPVTMPEIGAKDSVTGSRTQAEHQGTKTYAEMAKPAEVPSLPEFEIEGSSIQAPKEGMPSLYISKDDMDKAKANFSSALIMRFARVCPKLEVIRHVVSSWGLHNPLTVGVLDSRRILIRMITG